MRETVETIFYRHVHYINQGDDKCFFINQNKQTNKKESKLYREREREEKMATSGTYVTEVPLKGTVEKHYKKWRSENHAFPEAIGHHIQNVIIHDGEWDSHGAIKTWNYTCGITSTF